MSKFPSLLILVVGTMACNPGVPAPAFVTPFDSTPPAQISAYIGNLHFDTTEGAGDRQALTVGCPSACRPGPEVSIQPEERIHKNKKESLAKGPGRIIARLINRDPSEAYPPLNLGPGDTVYWAVDQVKPSKRDVSTGRSLYISAETLRGARKPVRTIPMRVRDHPADKPWKQGLARWVPVDSTYEEYEKPGGGGRAVELVRTYMSWGGCRSQSCCGP